MSHFVYDDTALFFPKTNLIPIPGGSDPTQWVQQTDWNTLNQATVDIKGVLRGAIQIGFTGQAVDPAPTGIDNYLWLDTSDDLFIHTGGQPGANVNLSAGGGGGETNTASNVDVGGVGVFKQKVSVDLEFKGVKEGSSKVTVTDSVGTNTIDIDITEANVVHDNLSGSGTNTHAQLDTHVGLFTTVAQGSIWFSDGAAPSALVPGTAGQFLQTQGAAADAVWTDSTLTIQDEGSPIANTPHTTLNFAGAGVSVADAGGGVSTVTIPLTNNTVVGSAISGGTANRVLYEDASNLLAESANLVFDGTDLSAGGEIRTTQTATTMADTTVGLYLYNDTVADSQASPSIKFECSGDSGAGNQWMEFGILMYTDYASELPGAEYGYLSFWSNDADAGWNERMQLNDIGQLLLEDGTVGLPSLSFMSAGTSTTLPNTGIYYDDSSTEMRFARSGALKLTISNSVDVASDLSIADAKNIVLATTTGTQIGTATGQKLAFYGITPVVQPTAITTVDATAIDATWDATEQAVVDNMRSRINDLESKLQSLGLLA